MANRNKLFDKLICLDLEASCEDLPHDWESEIIEVGVCLLDLKTLEISDVRGILVKPVSSPITPFCTNLTTITQELLDKEGTTLSEAMRILEQDYKIDKRTWASWGDYDRKMLLKDCKAKNLEFPGETRSHINIKNLMTIQFGWSKEVGLDVALEQFNLPMIGVHHRGFADANNIARVFKKHLNQVRYSWSLA